MGSSKNILAVHQEPNVAPRQDCDGAALTALFYFFFYNNDTLRQCCPFFFLDVITSSLASSRGVSFVLVRGCVL